MAIEQFQTNVELAAKIQTVLQSWPLYRVLQYKGADGLGNLPKVIMLFCQRCRKDTILETRFYAGENNRSGFASKTYECRNCLDWSATFFTLWVKLEDTYQITKVGQYPELEERVSQALETALSEEDLKMYKNALRLRNFSLGIAAVAYMRRIVENRMNDMLDVLHEAARAHNAPSEVLERHEEIKRQKRFNVKVDYAGDLLPSNLRPAGHPNPIAVLHELASDGLHAKSDDECVDIFDACRETFEYIFGKMRIEAEDAKRFVKGMSTLADKRAKLEPAQKPKSQPQ